MAKNKVEQELNGTTVATTYEFQFPQKKEPITIAQFFYDKKTGAICGRTPKSWFQITLFYIIFYIVLAALFAVSMQGLFATLRDDRPSYILDSSLIGINPGLGFRPLDEDADYGAVIQFGNNTKFSLDQTNKWIKSINEFLEPYAFENRTRNQVICNFGTTIKPDQVCAVDLEKFDPCLKKNEYGYRRSAPCVFLKLNKIYDWVPQYYDDVNDLPDDMPAKLKNEIHGLPADQRQQIWVSCEAKNKKSNESIGEIAYKAEGTQGFPSYFYPYKNVHGYLSPLVAVVFERPIPGNLIQVECRAWAKNIIYSGSMKDRKGSVEFQLLVD